jgi:hypothetical protein
MTIWLIALPVVTLGILFSGFEAISPAGWSRTFSTSGATGEWL